ncbi:hypothetical protein [Flexibacterium corallicola]|uniref:hypothetical protein n=1 Tax=Flexibacterium corallicola TaxID=3037259 RepID=UPI00286ED99F|nr:hypothetical protein [Pseudovibrio sp. M1P-2-3]
MNIETCPTCTEKFVISERGARFPGGKEHYPVNCPHCERVAFTAPTKGWWTTRKAKEADYMATSG